MNDLRTLFEFYKTENLVGIEPDDFFRHINRKLLAQIGNPEGGLQREYNVRFTWGHDHDFGTFLLRGRMKDRHITVTQDFMDLFDLKLSDFNQRDVLDVGCWTGGTTLMLAALGANVTAIEEVYQYAMMTKFLVESFGKDNAGCFPLSIYDDSWTERFGKDNAGCFPLSIYDDSWTERFDIVYAPGVIYHLSDPVLALRIMFNALKIGGIILIESATTPGHGNRCEFGRDGWNYFIPTQSALIYMMKMAGFDQIRTAIHGRLYACGLKTTEVGICRAGLSRPDIP